MATGDIPYLIENGSGVYEQRTKGWAGVHFVADETVTITTAATFYPWANATETLAKTITTAAANGRINLTVAGVYVVSFSVSLTGVATEKITTQLFKSGVAEVGNAQIVEVVGATDEETVSGAALVTSDGTNYVDLRFTSSASSTSIVIKRANMIAYLI